HFLGAGCQVYASLHSASPRRSGQGRAAAQSGGALGKNGRARERESAAARREIERARDARIDSSTSPLPHGRGRHALGARSREIDPPVCTRAEEIAPRERLWCAQLHRLETGQRSKMFACIWPLL